MAAAIEYAVDVLKVAVHHRVRALRLRRDAGAAEHRAGRPADPAAALAAARPAEPGADGRRHHAWARIAGRLPADAVEQLCLTNVVQQLEHLRAHESVARRLAEGALELHGMYFHVGEAQAYLLAEGASAGSEVDEVFDRVGPGDPNHAVRTTPEPITPVP